MLGILGDSKYDVWRYLEEWVNDGSPSGFNTGPPELYSFSARHSFRLDQILDVGENFRSLGDVDSRITVQEGATRSMLLHPVATISLKAGENSRLVDRIGKSHLNAFPTASGRTVWLEQSGGSLIPLQAKLHYPEILGRLPRPLPWMRAVCGVEVTNVLNHLISTSSFPRALGFLPELAAVAWQPADFESVDIGMVIRDTLPNPNHSADACLIPFFSLWGVDRLVGERAHILKLLMHEMAWNEDEVMEHLVEDLLESYFFLVNQGLLPEMNAQNCLLELNESGVTRIVLRDLTDFEKDINHLPRIYGEQYFVNSERKLFDSDRSRGHAARRYSLNFDFRLAGYILDPLIKAIATVVERSPDYLAAGVRGMCRARIGTWGEYLPDNGYWTYSREPFSGHRPYCFIEAKPPFR